MNNKEYKRNLRKLETSIVGTPATQRRSAELLLGVKRRQSQRMAAGHSSIPAPVAKLIACLIDSPHLRKLVEKIK